MTRGTKSVTGVGVIDRVGTVVSANPPLTNLVSMGEGATLHQALGHLTDAREPCVDRACPLLQPRDVAAGGGYLMRAEDTSAIEWTVTPLADGSHVVTVTDLSGWQRAAQDDRAVAPVLPPSVFADGLAVDVGGDLGGTAWDACSLPDGEVLILGADSESDESDVSDEYARADTWKVLYIARAHVTAGVPLAELVLRVSEAVSADAPIAPVRLVAVAVDPLTGYVAIVGGGAAPVLVVRSSGNAQWLPADGGSIGSVAPGSRALASTRVSGGDTVVIPSPAAFSARDNRAGAGLAAAAVALRRRQLTGLADAVLSGLPHDPRSGAGALLLRVS